MDRPKGDIVPGSCMQRIAEGLVTRALKTGNVLRVAAALRRLPPTECDAVRVSSAFTSGALDHWEAALLLRCIGHEAGYQTACRILNDPNLAYAGSHVGSVVAELGGQRASSDLLRFLTSAPTRVGREDAAWALVEFASAGAFEAIVEAALAGKIRGDCAGRLLLRLAIDVRTVERWLQSSDRVENALGCEIVVAAVPRRGPPSREWTAADRERLLALARDVVAARDVELQPRTRGRLVNP